jgi:chemotaxis protein MotB
VSKDKPKKIVIVKKKKAHGGGHHGGSWKVAYADFVTAMMAFFMVMWILGMDDNMKKAIEGYFANPVGYKKGGSSGGASPISTGSSPATVQQQALRLIVRNYEERRFSEVGDRLRARLNGQRDTLGLGAHVEVVVGNDGLRIELVEGRNGDTFFPSGSTQMKPAATLALGLVARELGELSHGVIVEGHTDSAPLDRADGYTNWELSAERANAARRVLEASGLGSGRIVEVRGLADRHPRVPEDPGSPANRRISILLPFTVLPDGTPARQAPST